MGGGGLEDFGGGGVTWFSGEMEEKGKESTEQSIKGGLLKIE